MLRAAVCDDEERCVNEIVSILKDYFMSDSIIIDKYYDGDELINSPVIADYDIIILDIEMGSTSGIEVKNLIEKNNIKAYIIFVTGYMDFVQAAFGKNVCGYISKPVDKVILCEKLAQIVEYIEQRELPIIDLLGNNVVIELSAITFIEINNIYSDIHLINQEKICVRKSLKDIADELDGDYFATISRKNIVNFRHTLSCTKEILLDSGLKLPIAKARQSDVKKRWNNYQIKRLRVI